MTIESVMTRDPSCCLPGDSVSTAARIMKQQDVGPVLVVSDQTGMQLLGIVTDRDIALEVVAEGRDPYSTRVDSVMSTNPISCREHEDVSEAVRIMAEYQVRRVPVVDEDGRVIGIVAQADIARHADEEEVGELVEEISQPFGAGEWVSGKHKQSQSSSGLDGTSALAMGLLCAGFGAGLMYLFDPSKGRRRRNQFADRSTELWNQRGEVLHKAQDLYDQAKSKVTGSESATGTEKWNTPSAAEEPAFR